MARIVAENAVKERLAIRWKNNDSVSFGVLVGSCLEWKHFEQKDTKKVQATP